MGCNINRQVVPIQRYHNKQVVMDMFHKIWHTQKNKGDISPLCGLDAEYTKGNVAKSIENIRSNPLYIKPYTQSLKNF